MDNQSNNQPFFYRCENAARYFVCKTVIQDSAMAVDFGGESLRLAIVFNDHDSWARRRV